MKVILLVDVKNVGKKNAVVDVKDGYGNFLVTSNKAILASDKAREIVNEQLAQEKEAYDAAVAAAKILKKKIEATKLEFSLKTNNGQAFGSISNKQVIEELEKQYQIKLNKFMFAEGQKNYGLGVHRIDIKLHKDVIAQLVIRIFGE